MDKFTRRADASGWLSVRLSRTGQLTSLCEYTRVKVVRDINGRTYFTIADGYVAVGEEASLTTANAAKYLSKVGPDGAVTVSVTYAGAPTEEVSPFRGKLKQQWANLSFGGQTATVTLNSVWDGRFQPIPTGTHAILAPDYSHRAISTAGYASATPGMIGNDVWFPIGLFGSTTNSSRYIHVGHLSDGCVTVHQLEKWAALYEYLISHRSPGSAGKLIGSLMVRK
jgi:hypothetical protein